MAIQIQIPCYIELIPALYSKLIEINKSALKKAGFGLSGLFVLFVNNDKNKLKSIQSQLDLFLIPYDIFHKDETRVQVRFSGDGEKLIISETVSVRAVNAFVLSMYEKFYRSQDAELVKYLTERLSVYECESLINASNRYLIEPFYKITYYSLGSNKSALIPKSVADTLASKIENKRDNRKFQNEDAVRKAFIFYTGENVDKIINLNIDEKFLFAANGELVMIKPKPPVNLRLEPEETGYPNSF